MPDRIPLALLPGLLTDAALWAHQIESLAVLAMTERIGRDAFLRQQAAIMGRPDSLPGLPGIACPTLVLCGRQDGPTPVECHQEIAAAIPGARLTVIEDSGHLTPMERPEAVSTALREWLAGWRVGPRWTPA
jgi:pimeloyl-ACP methyl ester carboxylesterase